MSFYVRQKITMKTILSLLLSSLYHLAAADDNGFSGEFTLAATQHMEGLMLAKEYKITISGGTATISYSNGTKVIEESGTVSLTMHTGKDPSAKTIPPFNGFIRVEFAKPGWVRDKTVTRIDLPFTAKSIRTSNQVTFDAEISVEIMATEVQPDGLVTYSDPMNIRIMSPYSVSVKKNPIVLP